MSTINRARYAAGVAAVSVSMVVLAACASSHTTTNAGNGGGSSPSSTSGLRTESTSIGTVAADSSGRTLYELVGDTTANQMCTGGCLTIWPAAMSGGTQVVLQGHPAFTFSGDTGAGQAHGQGVKDQWGTWYALDSNGAPITTAAPASNAPATGSSSSGGGGYGY
jgi:predicted lipoprotein with Yx(FWY)xxD motif